MDQDMIKRLGDLIHTLRRRRGLSQKRLAALARLPPSMVSEIEAGKRPQVSFGVIIRILKALGVSSIDFARLEDEETELEPAMSVRD